jgi:hypothetical protein
MYFLHQKAQDINFANQNAINAFLENDNKIFKVGKDSQGKEYLEIQNKSLWTWIAIKILNLKSYKLETVCQYIKSHIEEINQLPLNKNVSDFYEKMNLKVNKHNERGGKPISNLFNEKIGKVASSIVPENSSLPHSLADHKLAQADSKDTSFLMPDQPVKQEDVSYTKANNGSRDYFGGSYEDFQDKGFVKQWVAEQTNKRLGQIAMDTILKKASGHEKRSISHPNLAVPTANALKFMSQHYHEKYNIVIRATDLQDLGPLITELQSKIKEPLYIGILVSQNLDADTSHVTPILCYFDGKQGKKNEFLILDSVAGKHYIDPVLEQLHTHKIPKGAINYSTKIRQADNYSCRTSSIVLLRNALLSLRYHNHQNGFAEALKAGKLNKDRTIDELPPEWDYTEQISNKIASSHTLVIRNYFSKKPEKRNKQETVGEHRQRYTENVTTKHTVWGNKSDYRKQFQEIGVPDKNHRINIDKDTEIYAGESITELEFTQNRLTNVYLLKKGLSNQNKTVQVKLGG